MEDQTPVLITFLETRINFERFYPEASMPKPMQNNTGFRL